MDVSDIRLEKEPAYMRLEGQVEMHIQDGTVLRGPLMIHIPLRRIVRDDEPRIVLHCIHMTESDVTVSYSGSRPAADCQFAAEDHAALFRAGLMLTSSAIELTAPKNQLNQSGLNKQDVDFAILPNADPLRSVLSIRYAFHAHDEHNNTQLKRWLQKQYGQDVYSTLFSDVQAGGSRTPAGSETNEIEDGQLMPVSSFSFGGTNIRPQLVAERTARHENSLFTSKAKAPLHPDDAGKVRVHFEELENVETNPKNAPEALKERLLERFQSIGSRVVIDIPYAAGQIGVRGAAQYPICGLMHRYHHKRSHLRLFIERPMPPKHPHINRVPAQDEMALALDRHFISGMVWDAFAAINTDMRSRYGVPGDLSRWSATCEDRQVKIDAMLDIDGWLDPGRIHGSFKTMAKVGNFEIRPDLKFDLPVTAKLLGVSTGLAALVAGGGLGFCLTSFFAFLGFAALQSLNTLLNSGAGSQSGLDMDLVEISIEDSPAFIPRVRTAQTSSDGILLSGRLERMIQPLAENRDPLTVQGNQGYQLTGRREIAGRTVAYRLNSGDIVPIDRLILLIEGAGLPLRGVHVVRAATCSYLRANPDAKSDNNLTNLPRV